LGEMIPGKKATFRDVFSIAEYRALWTAQVLSLLGDQFAAVAIAILVYDRSRSPFLTALVFALTLLIPLAAGPHLAALADIFPRRRMMICCDVLRAILVAVIALPGIPVWAVCMLVVATALGGIPSTAGRSAMLPVLLAGDKLAVGQAAGLLANQFSTVVGVVAGAAVVAAVGVHVTFLADALTFALSAVLLWRWVRPRPAPEWLSTARRSARAGARLGIRLVTRDPVARLLVMFGLLGGFYTVTEVLAAPYAHALGEGPAAIGLLLAAPAAGGMAGAATVTSLISPSRRMQIIGWLAILACAPLIGSFFRPPLPAVLALWLISGWADGYQLIAMTAFARQIPDSGRAAAMGVAVSGLRAAMGTGFLAGGAVAGVIGPQAAVGWAGVTGVAAAAILCAVWSRVRPAASSQPPQGRSRPADNAPLTAQPGSADI
jgi:MFS family permease